MLESMQNGTNWEPTLFLGAGTLQLDGTMASRSTATVVLGGAPGGHSVAQNAPI